MSAFKGLQPHRIEAIALSDNAQPELIHGLRVTNKSSGWATLVVRAGGDRAGDATLQFPPNAITFEPGLFSHVKSTGSTPIAVDFVVHGYIDPQNA